MDYALELEIRNHLADYLEANTSITDFRDWFLPFTWDVENSGSSGAAALAFEIELRFAEFTNGHRTEQELRDTLKKSVQRTMVGTPAIVTGTSARTESPGIQFAWAGTRFSVVPA